MTGGHGLKMTWALTVGNALETIDDTALTIIVILNILYVLCLTLRGQKQILIVSIF